eukprot:8561240-Pyramimonas_sp.AAC.1
MQEQRACGCGCRQGVRGSWSVVPRAKYARDAQSALPLGRASDVRSCVSRCIGAHRCFPLAPGQAVPKGAPDPLVRGRMGAVADATGSPPDMAKKLDKLQVGIAWGDRLNEPAPDPRQEHACAPSVSAVGAVARAANCATKRMDWTRRDSCLE